MQLSYRAVESHNEWFDKQSVQDLVIVLTKRVNGVLVRYYFDYLCKQEVHDTLFVRQGWKHLLTHSQLFDNVREMFL
jgi:hypothetical protein